MRILALNALLVFAAGAVTTTIAAPAASETRRELTKLDVDAWLDGYLPYALNRGDVAGAIVVIVKDGQVLTQRGYGFADVGARKPVDPQTTLFRPGSISKLFTWTAVMQLVERGKIDLDADVNRYLDFNIPAYEGHPLTVRQLMTHETGFEQAIKGLILLGGPMQSMGEVLKRWIPKQVVAPGTIPAYSNYGAGLAGYIVQRVSGIPFEEYVEREIFQPLGMTHSTFRQPPPAPLSAAVAKGYPRASAEPKPYEFVELSAAGGSAVSGPDMARFMIAHLHEGAGLMQPQTARLMHTPAYAAVPGANRMALGFCESRINGLSAIGHDGDSLYFHSDLWLFPSEDVGLFISMNSMGPSRGVAVDPIRKALFEGFADRYFPAPHPQPLLELPTAKEHARMLVGSYFSSTGSFSNFADIANFLGQTRVELDAAGRPLVASLRGAGDAPSEWIEVAPFVWQDARGHEILGAKAEHGRIVRFGIHDPATVWERVPGYRDAAWLQPLFLAALLALALTAVSWPIGAVARRCYKGAASAPANPSNPYRLVSLFCAVVVVILLGWASFLSDFIELVNNDGSLDWQIRLLQIGGAIGIFGLTAAVLWNLKRVWQGAGGRFQKFWSVVLVLAALPVLWVMFEFHLLSLGTNY